MDAMKILGTMLASGALGGGSSNGVIGNLLGSALGGQQGGSGMAGMLGSLLGGGGQQGGGGMAGMLGGLMGGGQQQQGGGGMAGMLGGLMGGGQQQQGGQQQGGGMGDMLGSLLGGGMPNSQGGSSNSLGSLLTGAVGQFAQTQDAQAPNFNDELFSDDQAKQDAQEQATFVIRAMINAAKADGQVDSEEQERIMGKLQGLSQEEAAFIRDEFNAPLDVDAFIQSIPAGSGEQVYTVSLMAIDLDTNQEAKYLHKLAQGLNLAPEKCNQIHEQLGAPVLYS